MKYCKATSTRVQESELAEQPRVAFEARDNTVRHRWAIGLLVQFHLVHCNSKGLKAPKRCKYLRHSP